MWSTKDNNVTWHLLLILKLCANPTHSCLLMCIIPPCVISGRAEAMHSEDEASSFPERVEAEASDVHSSVEHASVCLPPERGSPGLACLHQHISNMLRTAFSDLLQPTDAVMRQKRKTRRWSGDSRKPPLMRILLHFLISAFTHLHYVFLMSSPTTFYPPVLVKKKASLMRFPTGSS